LVAYIGLLQAGACVVGLYVYTGIRPL